MQYFFVAVVFYNESSIESVERVEHIRVSRAEVRENENREIK